MDEAQYCAGWRAGYAGQDCPYTGDYRRGWLDGRRDRGEIARCV